MAIESKVINKNGISYSVTLEVTKVNNSIDSIINEFDMVDTMICGYMYKNMYEDAKIIKYLNTVNEATVGETFKQYGKAVVAMGNFLIKQLKQFGTLVSKAISQAKEKLLGIIKDKINKVKEKRNSKSSNNTDSTKALPGNNAKALPTPTPAKIKVNGIIYEGQNGVYVAIMKFLGIFDDFGVNYNPDEVKEVEVPDISKFYEEKEFNNKIAALHYLYDIVFKLKDMDKYMTKEIEVLIKNLERKGERALKRGDEDAEEDIKNIAKFKIIAMDELRKCNNFIRSVTSHLYKEVYRIQ